MQLGDRRRLGAQSGDLAEHEEAVSRLVFVAHRGQSGEPAPWLRSTPLVATRRRPTFKPSRASRISSARAPLGHQPFLLLLETSDKRRAAHPHLVARARLEQNGFLAANDLILEARDDRTRS